MRSVMGLTPESFKILEMAQQDTHKAVSEYEVIRRYGDGCARIINDLVESGYLAYYDALYWITTDGEKALRRERVQQKGLQPWVKKGKGK